MEEVEKRGEEARFGVKKQRSANGEESLLFIGWKIALTQEHQPSARALVSAKPDHEKC